MYFGIVFEKISKKSIMWVFNPPKIYLIYTILGIVLYVLAGMPVFDSVCNTFSIISTGGMSVKNANMGFYNDDLIYFITIVLMILGATSFLVHYRLIKTRGKSLVHDSQFKVMISIIAISTLLIFFNFVYCSDGYSVCCCFGNYHNRCKHPKLNSYGRMAAVHNIYYNGAYAYRGFYRVYCRCN